MPERHGLVVVIRFLLPVPAFNHPCTLCASVTVLLHYKVRSISATRSSISSKRVFVSKNRLTLLASIARIMSSGMFDLAICSRNFSQRNAGVQKRKLALTLSVCSIVLLSASALFAAGAVKVLAGQRGRVVISAQRYVSPQYLLVQGLVARTITTHRVEVERFGLHLRINRLA
jgi:hypothetical protein